MAFAQTALRPAGARTPQRPWPRQPSSHVRSHSFFEHKRRRLARARKSQSGSHQLSAMRCQPAGVARGRQPLLRSHAVNGLPESRGRLPLQPAQQRACISDCRLTGVSNASGSVVLQGMYGTVACRWQCGLKNEHIEDRALLDAIWTRPSIMQRRTHRDPLCGLHGFRHACHH